MARCDLPRCEPEEMGCHLGNALHKCPHYGGTSETRSQQAVIDVGDVFPWTGNAFGEGSVEFVAARSGTRLIGLVGPSDAGKTTFLIALYLELTRGKRLHRRKFAGSYSLQGWENRASNFRTESWNHPRFPLHTTAGGGRVPGMLHLAFRTAGLGIEDVLITDTPGEWFSDWGVAEEHLGAEGARWIAEHADGFVFFIDRAGLAGPDKLEKLNDLRLIALRLGHRARGRPVAAVWAKSDVEVPPPMLRRMRAALADSLPGVEEFEVSVTGPEHVTGVRAVMEWVLDRAGQRKGLALPEPVPVIDDPFYRYR